MIQSDTLPTPLVTAIVSTYKSSGFIRGCLDSLAAQTIVDRLEVIVVISGSPENEWEIVREYEDKLTNLVLIRTGNREGLYTAWNRAIKLARGEFITNANTDDRLHPRALEKLVAVLLADRELGLVYGDCIQTEQENETFETTTSTEMLENQDYSYYDLHRHCFIGPCPMWRRIVHEIVGYFDDDKYWSAADYDFWLRMGMHYPMTHLRDTVGLFQNRKDSLAHMQVGKDESDAIMRHYRENADLNAIFPGLKADSSPDNYAAAFAAMADLCIEGPWQVDWELALEYLQLAADLHPTLENDVNRSVLLTMNGRVQEAIDVLSHHSSDPKALHNLSWIDSIIKNQQTTSPIMIRTRHPIVIEARKLNGVDPAELKSEELLRENAAFYETSPEDLSDKDSEQPAAASILLVESDRPINTEAPIEPVELALTSLAKNFARQGKRVTVAAPLQSGSITKYEIDYLDIGAENKYEAALDELAPHHSTLITFDNPEVLKYSSRFDSIKKRLLWLQLHTSDRQIKVIAEEQSYADSIICATEAQRSRLLAEGISGSKLEVIPYGTDPEVYYSRPVHRDHCRICFKGTIDSKSGIDVLLDAFQKMKQSLPQAVLDVFGEPVDGTNLIDFKSWKGKGVNFHGNVSENRLAEAYSRSSLLVIPTRIEEGESCGINSLNAQACACPVLTTSCAGAMETIVDRMSGRLLEQDTSDAIASAMIQMLMDPLRLRIMGETGRAHVLQHYTWIQITERVLRLIETHDVQTRPNLPHLNAPIKLGDPAIDSHELEWMRSVRSFSKVYS